MQRVGILGGTFDPVHNAHLEMARVALQALSLDRVLFIPIGAPDYRKPPVASAQDRLAMLRLATSGEPRFAIDERELACGASPYTADTLAALRAELGAEAELHLLMGSDQYAKLAQWQRPDEVARLAEIAVFERPGSPAAGAGAKRIPMPPLAISASDIRARARRGADLSNAVPAAVANYISLKRLYS